MVRVFSGAKIGSDMCGKGKRLNAILALSQLSYGPVERAHAQMRAVSDSGQFKLAALICQQIYEKSRLAPQGTILQDGRDAVLHARCKSYQFALTRWRLTVTLLPCEPRRNYQETSNDRRANQGC